MDRSPQSSAVADSIRTVSFLEPLSAEQRWALAQESTVRSFPPGADIVVEGEYGDTFYIIRRGSVLVCKRLEDEYVEIGRRDTGTFFGEMALIQDEPRSATVQAETEVVTIAISRAGFERVLLQNPKITVAVLTELSRRLREADQHTIAYLKKKNRQLQQAYRHIIHSYDATLVALGKALDLRDAGTEGHSVRVAEIAVTIGEQMGVSSRRLRALRWGGLLHDIGKIGIPDTILYKENRLTEPEWQIMYQHPTWGAQILGHIRHLKEALQIVRYHHEAWDGSGYPDGLRGTEIPLLARIFMVADTYDAITSDRPYRSARSPERAREIIREQVGRRFDPTVVEAFEVVFPELCEIA